ncbi:precorrin-6Y C5,15-methyltransferase subunit CbiT [Cyanobacterium aponinum UTEX 3222]|nr:precorrin-6Y C5,15-methyltransferase subunit CbiT [Cyanobacterium aponinum]MBD2395160.1 precorrin-6Y C5,15-methyltransferase subunit CbiT [Cyanobacterium aponinum FACHB-4101]WPF89341.1 precorrin-6Y C5,15-methyltransferase subunit CbiT [Cyanobacterium aponinum AL20115]WRL38431.1 precorrin-6Y C5,15-methyltransferase subunit CbiT [Cyanobacterium aponinum UTEX 3221]WRL42024.1 precorrin-6Y C5,15-methyltransferase subunit CbiT [Cyanobacterium aponinum UTEX 3222]
MWQYKTPGIPDELFDRLPGIPMTKREVRLLILSGLRLEEKSVIWDIGAGTGTISIEIGLLCPNTKIIAIERDPEVAGLIRQNCRRFEVENVEVVEGNAPDCFDTLPEKPDRICIGGGKSIKNILTSCWGYLPEGGRLVATASNLENLYQISEGLAELRACNIEVVQSSINRLEKRGLSQVFAAIAPIFILSGEKIS